MFLGVWGREQKKNGSQIEAFLNCAHPSPGQHLKPKQASGNRILSVLSELSALANPDVRVICGDFRLGFAEACLMKQSFPDQLIKDLSRAGGVAQLVEWSVFSKMALFSHGMEGSGGGA